MTLEEAEKRFLLPPGLLEQYISYGFLRKDGMRKGMKNYRDEDFEYLGLIRILMDAGFASEDTKRYLRLLENQGTEQQQIRMLQKQRRVVLDDVHKRQQVLDQLDFMIWEKKKQIQEEAE